MFSAWALIVWLKNAYVVLGSTLETAGCLTPSTASQALRSAVTSAPAAANSASRKTRRCEGCTSTRWPPWTRPATCFGVSGDRRSQMP